ncbi:hypothetical protein FB593_1011481 [Rhizobium sp. SJZ105]|uniref:hypothetical protein n=1 Tax=Rhizobium sp. SJZ105 TaxID=2572678 RepID=UPI0011AA87CC|nr:hypothetical protein [Rhizobium sp. SJZ105]TWC90201.1 hypothetical protein FB593_1011481 [Rhizobium sp. SJZ105]
MRSASSVAYTRTQDRSSGSALLKNYTKLSGQSLFENGIELSGLGWFDGTSDAAPSGVFDSWLSQLFTAVRENQRIKKQELVYSYFHTLYQPKPVKKNSALMLVMLQELEGRLAPFVISLGSNSEDLTHPRHKVAIHYGDAAQVVLELPDVQGYPSSRSQWIASARAMFEIGKDYQRVEDIAEIINLIESRLQGNLHEEVSDLFAVLNTENTPIAFLVAALRITLPCRDQIANWSLLRSRTSVAIEGEGRNSAKLLRGLID